MESPTKRVEELMSEFRRDVDGWQVELKQLKAEGRTDLAETIEGWTREAERVLARWSN
jgi:Mg-chelatase subunit ChlD